MSQGRALRDYKMDVCKWVLGNYLQMIYTWDGCLLAMFSSESFLQKPMATIDMDQHLN